MQCSDQLGPLFFIYLKIAFISKHFCFRADARKLIANLNSQLIFATAIGSACFFELHTDHKMASLSPKPDIRAKRHTAQNALLKVTQFI